MTQTQFQIRHRSPDSASVHSAPPPFTRRALDLDPPPLVQPFPPPPPIHPPPDAAAASSINVFLPDDILEMCLVRLRLSSLMNVRLVCRNGRSLTSTPRFMQMRREGLFYSPWLFLFGVVKDSYCSGEIHALDVSLRKWNTIEVEFLKGRYLFSVASIQDDVYVVDGCSSLTNYGRIDKRLNNNCSKFSCDIVLGNILHGDAVSWSHLVFQSKASND